MLKDSQYICDELKLAPVCRDLFPKSLSKMETSHTENLKIQKIIRTWTMLKHLYLWLDASHFVSSSNWEPLAGHKMSSKSRSRLFLAHKIIAAHLHLVN